MTLDEVLLRRIEPCFPKLEALGIDAAMFTECFMSTARTTLRYNSKGELT